MGNKLFGTDGIRGIANKMLTPEFALRFGKTVAKVLMENYQHELTVLIGRDTRASGPMLEFALAAGLSSMGAQVKILGVLPTPAVAYLVQKHEADIGIMISASHNPAEYNGVKVFNSRGFKISDAYEEEIETILQQEGDILSGVSGDAVGKISMCDTAVDEYTTHLKTAQSGIVVAKRQRKLRVLFDCANGSASATAEKIFSVLPIDAHITQDEPDGKNINRQCGSLYVENLGRRVAKEGFDLGIAFDGDADRVLMVDENGAVVDGDRIMALLAKDFQKKGTLEKDTIVGTVMSNLGLFRFAKRENINIVTTGVGDRFVLEEMERSGYNIGGEQSGHIILRDFQTTGDGQLTALMVLDLVLESGKKLSELADIMEVVPQILENVRVNSNAERDGIMKDAEVLALEKEWSEKLADNGRILIRPSGTEPLIRVMVEGLDADQIRACTDALVEKVKERKEAYAI